jgi:diguanylate cyclase (GGDEF)-like protein
MGDRLLIEVAGRMQEALRAGDTVARLGGDEFVFLLLGLRTIDECEGALARLLAAIAKPFDLDGNILAVSASIGVTLFPFDDADPDTLLRHADQAMYQAKQTGKNRYRFHGLDDGPQGRGKHLRLAVSR